MNLYQDESLEPDEIRLLELHAGDPDAELEANIYVYMLPENEEPVYGHEVLVTRDGGFDVPKRPGISISSFVLYIGRQYCCCLNVFEDPGGRRLLPDSNYLESP